MISSQTLAVVYGISSAVAWGAADFNGGLASRKGMLLGVVASSQTIGGAFLLLAAIFTFEPVPPLAHFAYGGLAGLFGILGLLALYQGLAQGRMGIVAPLSAVLTTLVPMGYTMLHQGMPSILQMTGFVFFVVAVWLLSSGDASFKMALNELFLSVAAGLGFGLFFIFIDQANDVAVFWPLAGARLVSISFILVVIRIMKKPFIPVPGQWKFIILAGVLDAAGNCLFSMAARLGRLDIAAVLSSLYPAATVLLAFVFLKEKLHRVQWLGVAAAFVSLVLISV